MMSSESSNEVGAMYERAILISELVYEICNVYVYFDSMLATTFLWHHNKLQDSVS